ncbi:MAG: hypothetical protein KatS3mg035_0376 [Bacteroidia bacterium]|nr:MAG: hypothetical protein KatS3mg035_0376 [Bacteroidia bacterium]
MKKNANKWNEKIETQVLMLKPALAYAAGRQNSVEPFKEYIEAKIDQLMYSEDKDKGLEKFLMLIESFVAYHKFHGGN